MSGPGSKLFDTLIVFLKEFYFEISQQATSIMQRVSI